RPRYLHTSPEFAMKKLITAGEQRIFAFARVFRNGEAGALHAPEFTMLEWYRAGEPYGAVMADCAAILAEAARAVPADCLRWRGRAADPFADPVRLTVVEAFRRFAGIDLARTISAGHTEPDVLVAAARCRGIRIAPDDTWSDVFSHVLSEKVEPEL